MGDNESGRSRRRRCDHGAKSGSSGDQTTSGAPPRAQGDPGSDSAHGENRFCLEDDPCFEEIGIRWHHSALGMHMPLLHELILGAPFFQGRVEADARALSGSLVAHMAASNMRNGPLVEAVKSMANSPTSRIFCYCSRALHEEWRREPGSKSYMAGASARCDFYAAFFDDPDGIFRTAGRAFAFAYDSRLSDVERLHLLRKALVLLAKASWTLPDVLSNFGYQKGAEAIDCLMRTDPADLYDFLLLLGS